MNDLFGNNFLDTRDNYILPLVGYNTKISKYNHWNFKNNFINKSSSIINNGQGNISFVIEEDYILNGIVYDMELWLNKIVIQFDNYQKTLKNKGTWSVVSLYYLNFYLINLIFRIKNKGCFYLNEKNTNDIANCYNCYTGGEVIKLNRGNYRYSIIKDVNKYILTLKPTDSGNGIHNASWTEFDKILYELLSKSNGKERIILNKFKEINSYYKPGFQSALRNDLNYPSESSMYDIEDGICLIDINTYNGSSDKFFQDLVGITLNDDINTKIKCLSFHSIYLFNFVNLLYTEYFNRNGISKDFSRERNKFIKKTNLVLPNF